jgi:hypothetical protein
MPINLGSQFRTLIIDVVTIQYCYSMNFAPMIKWNFKNMDAFLLQRQGMNIPKLIAKSRLHPHSTYMGKN